jgi:hypothetical protein
MIRQGVCEDIEEGGFPKVQILQTFRLVNMERRAVREVLAVYQPIDDGGGIGKYGAYTNQSTTSFHVLGRCRNSEMLCSQYSAM